jgi:hypothetical protein
VVSLGVYLACPVLVFVPVLWFGLVYSPGLLLVCLVVLWCLSRFGSDFVYECLVLACPLDLDFICCAVS